MSSSLLAQIDPELRRLLPANLYTLLWVEPSAANLMQVFEHLRSLSRLLGDYLPPSIVAQPPPVGQCRHTQRQGTLLFTDLAGFTPLMEFYSTQGPQGNQGLWAVLNRYFGLMGAIVSKSGGNLLEFTGDALLVEFPWDEQRQDLARAVRAGLRMQRAMTDFAEIVTPQGSLSLQMRVGIHSSEFLSIDVGTPLRMMRILLGEDVQRAKRAEGAGRVGRVCLTVQTSPLLEEQFRFEPQSPGYQLVVDDLSDATLGEYDLPRARRRSRRALLLDRSEGAIAQEIQSLVRQLLPLASYLSPTVLRLAVANVSQRQIAPQFVVPTVVFVNLVGLSTAVERLVGDEVTALVAACNQLFSLINAIVLEAGGILRNPTYNLDDPVMVLYFDNATHRGDDVLRAVSAAIAILDLIAQTPPLQVQGQPYPITGRIGIARGMVFAAEIGERRGRRQFNLLGDAVNTAARLMSKAGTNQILLTQKVHDALEALVIPEDWTFHSLGLMNLKGKTHQMVVYTVNALTPGTELPLR
ncbi:MAG: adenylate/guanylate cyclase domain-containing protein [Cyanobacteria bacterium P01_G01_bin.54]